MGSARAALRATGPAHLNGTIESMAGLAVEIAGLSHALALGDRVQIAARSGLMIAAEVVGFRNRTTIAMPFGQAEGLGPGSPVVASWDRSFGSLAVCSSWIGRVIDPLGRPLDGRGALPGGAIKRPVRALPPDATTRGRLGPSVEFGVRALDLFTPSRMGQRLGLFAGSGVGKSTLLSMLAKQGGCDVVVIALVGERGREVREFLEDELGPAGLEKSVVVVATSDSPPLLRREAAYAAMTIAETFRDDGKHVLLLMDSVTRFCLALREIGLSAGEPPATRGYPPSVFAELPRLLERAGPGKEAGDGTGFITALFTVLVEGDDQMEPVADGVRGILDGHVVLDRKIAERGRYPAIDVLRSLSRSAMSCNTPGQRALVAQARAMLATYADLSDMIRLGAYRSGSDPKTDEAVRLAPEIEALLRQAASDRTSSEDSFRTLALILAQDG